MAISLLRKLRRVEEEHFVPNEHLVPNLLALCCVAMTLCAIDAAEQREWPPAIVRALLDAAVLYAVRPQGRQVRQAWVQCAHAAVCAAIALVLWFLWLLRILWPLPVLLTATPMTATTTTSSAATEVSVLCSLARYAVATMVHWMLAGVLAAAPTPSIRRIRTWCFVCSGVGSS